MGAGFVKLKYPTVPLCMYVSSLRKKGKGRGQEDLKGDSNKRRLNGDLECPRITVIVNLSRVCARSPQSAKRQQYLDMRFMHDFDPDSLAIANAWLDPEVCKHLGKL